jgi:penicillin-binding protein 2
LLFDWHHFLRRELPTPAVVDPQRRMRIGMAAFALLLMVVLARAVQLEVSEGAVFRAEAVKPLRRETVLPGMRGRILASDGAVLACDRKTLALAMHYRWLQDPPDARWLRQTARKALPKADRRNAERLAEAETRLRDERERLARRLAGLCGLRADEWAGRTREIQDRVERISERVNRHHAARHANRGEDSEERGRSGTALSGVLDVLRTTLEDRSSAPLVVAEELQYHVVADDVPASAVAEIKADPDQYPGVQVVERLRREYPQGTLAAHVVGHLGPPPATSGPSPPAAPHHADLVGAAGVERECEELLQGRRGLAVDLTDHGGRVLSACREQEPGVGSDVALTLDLRIQRSAEELLDNAIERRAIGPEQLAPAGGAAVVMHVETGALLAAASSPRFDPGLFVGKDVARRAALLTDGAHPLFDRATRMALPLGSLLDALPDAALAQSRSTGPPASLAPLNPNDAARRQRQATPLQVARLIAAVANGGRLVTPRVLAGDAPASEPCAGLEHAALAKAQEPLRRIVADPQAMTRDLIDVDPVAIAGETGAVVSGEASGAHAWFAGYVPVDRPEFAIVVAMEHSIDADTAAAAVAKRLVLRMKQAGLL